MASIMKTALLTGPRQIEIREVPVPDLDPEGFLMQVIASAICGSDVRAWDQGVTGRGGIGHEVLGTILELGRKVQKEFPFSVGDRVIVAPTSCGVCHACLSGNEHMCAERTHAGFLGPGGFSEILSVPGQTLEKGAVYAVPNTLDPAVATLVEPFACVLNGQDKLNVGPGVSVAVIGGGPIGVMHAALCRYRGADQVYISDMNMERLKMASWVGADFYIDARKEDTVDVVLSKTNGFGVDCVIVACSSPLAQSSAVKMAKTLGQVLFFSGLKRGEEEVPLDVQSIHRKEITLRGSRNAGRRHFRLALRFLSEERLPLYRLITRRFKLFDINQAFWAVAQGQDMKAVMLSHLEP